MNLAANSARTSSYMIRNCSSIVQGHCESGRRVRSGNDMRTYTTDLTEGIFAVFGRVAQNALEDRMQGTTRIPKPSLAILIPSDQICGQLSNHFTVDQLKNPADLQLAFPALGAHAMHALFCAEDGPEKIEFIVK
jgi:hypothetical protein